MIERRPAPVRPRVLLPGASSSLPLDDEIQSRLEAGAWGVIELIGRSGSGKTTALVHLASRFGDEPALALIDRPDAAEVEQLLESADRCLVVCASPAVNISPAVAEIWRLAPWGLDECIEYLLAEHHPQCASVMARLKADRKRLGLAGLPELWRVVLDRLAMDESLTDVKSAL